MDIPALDKRSKEDILNEFLYLAEKYTPQWKVTENDAGVILANIFSEQLYDSIKRYNKIPYKNMVYFLNLMGADILPSMPSKGYITAKLNEGTPKGVYIKRGTEVYGQDDNGERVLFQTENHMMAVDNDIESIYSYNSQENILVKSYEKGINEKIVLFDFKNGKNLHKDIILFDGGYAVSVNNNFEIHIEFENKYKKNMGNILAKLLSDENNAKWVFIDNEIEVPLKVLRNIENRIDFISQYNIPKSEFIGVTGRWIGCKILNIDVNSLVSITDIKVSSSVVDINPDIMYSNDIPLSNENFLPFNEKFSIYDDFYIKCDNVFNKRNANINLDMNIDVHITENNFTIPDIKWKNIHMEAEFKTPKSQNIYVDKVIWEYWNGIGWSRLFQDNNYDNVFKISENKNVKISFKCPDNIYPIIVGSEEGYWIRCRIINVNNMMLNNISFVAPIIKNIKLSYYYSKEYSYKIPSFVREQDCQLNIFDLKNDKEIILFENNKKQFPTAYFRLKNHIKEMPVNIFFKNTYNSNKMPSLKWQYWGTKNGNKMWIEFKNIDETKCFSKTGIITFIGADNFENEMLFGEDGYWIRAVNIDSSYDLYNGKLPSFDGIYFNTVKIVQKENMKTEYFYNIEEKKNFKVKLSSGYIIDIDVWVDEVNELIGEERYASNYNNNDDIIIKNDDKGLIKEYWVKWKRTDNFYDKKSDDRVYILNQIEGTILFGNGINGKIPPSSENESIMVKYNITSGSKGNFKSNEIKGFSDPIPFISDVTNIDPIWGGYDEETSKEAVERSKKYINHQNRAVTSEDYSILVKNANRNIKDVKISFENNTLDTVKIAVLPKEFLWGDNYFEEIRKSIFEYIQDKIPVTLLYNGGIDIFETEYIEYSLNLTVTINDYNDYQKTYTQIEKVLEEYINPISGNTNKKGFSIGNLPTKIKIYNQIKNIPTIKVIDSMNIFCYAIENGIKKEIDYDRIFEREFSVPINGSHEININLAQEMY